MKYEIPRFDGSNFTLLKMKMRMVLIKDSCEVALQEKECKPQKMTDRQFEEKDRLTVANLYLTLDDSVLFKIEVETTVKGV